MQAVEDNGGQSALERKTGVSQKNLSKYISDKADAITAAIWEKLEPTLRPYLKNNGLISGEVNSFGDNSMVFNRTKKLVNHATSATELEAVKRQTLIDVIDKIMAMEDLDSKVVLTICRRLNADLKEL